MEYLSNLIQEHDENDVYNNKDEIFSILQKNRHLFFYPIKVNIEYFRENFGVIQECKTFNLMTYSKYLKKNNLYDSLEELQNLIFQKKMRYIKIKKNRSRSRDR